MEGDEFVNQLKNCKILKHPNIIKYHAIFWNQSKRRAILLMELFNSQTLEEVG
jgi:serine/threonine protein kinase